MLLAFLEVLGVPSSTSAPIFGPSGRGRGVSKMGLDPVSFPFEAIWTDQLAQSGKSPFCSWLTDRRNADVA